MATQPLVSILMPLYNGEQYLQESIDSILQQAYSNFELIILDDGSTDNSVDLAKTYTDQRIRLEKNGKNLGIVATRNKLLEFAKGKYIAIHDCDDVIEPSKLAKQVAYLEKHQDCGVCGTWAKKVNGKSKKIGGIHLPTANEDIKINLLFQSSFVHSSVLMRKADFAISYNANFPVSMDFDLWERLSHQTRFHNIPQHLVGYRWHEENVSNQKKELQESKRNAIIRRQLERLGEFAEEEVQTIIAVGNLQKSTSLQKLSNTLRKLAIYNKEKQIFTPHKFNAFVWYRWIFYCAFTKQYRKILSLKLSLCNPKTLFYLGRLLLQKLKGSLFA